MRTNRKWVHLASLFKLRERKRVVGKIMEQQFEVPTVFII